MPPLREAWTFEPASSTSWVMTRRSLCSLSGVPAEAISRTASAWEQRVSRAPCRARERCWPEWG